MGKEFHIKGSGKILATIKSFSATEKFIFGIFTIAIIISAISLAIRVNKAFMVPIPSRGGELSEGIIDLPRYVNPILALRDVDRDLSALIYSGLMKFEDGKIVPDLAEKYTISGDGLTYTFTLKKDIRFHDGIPLTTDDVEFTIEKIQDSTIKSPRRVDWADVSIKKLSGTEISFILKQPYAPFLSNTTIGIIPKHIWSKVDSDQFIFSQYNIEPIGSGPYKLDNIKHDSGGIPEYYAFSPFNRYHGDEAYIAKFNIYFFSNEKAAIEAYNRGVIQSLGGISPSEVAKIASSSQKAVVIHSPLPKIFGIFFNQNQAPVLANIEIRQALNMAIDKDDLVKKVLLGYGVRSDGPLPIYIATTTSTSGSHLEEAKALLAKSGWTIGENGILQKKDKKSTQTLEFSIATAEAPDLKQAAEIIKGEWEKLGAKITVKVFEYGDLSQNVIAPRRYDSLLFGEFIGKDLDLYAFWHSSQRNAPGLNVALYVNSKVNSLLEDIRTISDEKIKKEKYNQFEKIIKDEVPAVFLYSPEYIYIVPNTIKGMEKKEITTPSDRFLKINNWYITTDNVWKIFVK